MIKLDGNVMKLEDLFKVNKIFINPEIQMISGHNQKHLKYGSKYFYRYNDGSRDFYWHKIDNYKFSYKDLLKEVLVLK